MLCRATHHCRPVELPVIGADINAAPANFPWPTKAFVPNSRLSYDMRELVEQCMESIEQQRCGCKPKSRLIPARFAEELPAERRGIES